MWVFKLRMNMTLLQLKGSKVDINLHVNHTSHILAAILDFVDLEEMVIGKIWKCEDKPHEKQPISAPNGKRC